ncbi:hypothetical protein [Shewanella ulleungensis]|uniref:RiboL-PSP-HEPN domain-containing protein n=1 Tax=Shewanella ulleungensis TaxID=2282699 RepID=A0ABQ2QPK7_9GAMM|nr:hypothetical protein [Shewanella ulleungensis]MCL1150300.1 hypothetical protein [Shewanella ulleungensis]GGP88462.1 hypothetical protein GCM10009410_23000 [Shewanella ulleungensis]
MINEINTLDFSEIVKVQAITQTIDTENLFDREYKELNISPIDQFLTNANKINLLWVSSSDVSREMATIAFLGYMSAVESYVRALVRGLVQVDIHSQKSVSLREITFGAALHHTKQLLPEALMDEFSFTHSDNIKKTFSDLLDLKLSLNNQAETEFNKICQLRHCCVHRFGKLGAKNAMKLGIDKHSALFEKPLNLNMNDLGLVAQNLRSIVKQINNSAYKEVLNRTFPIHKNQAQRKEWEKAGIVNMWSKNYTDDKDLFRVYYNLFSTKVDTVKSESAQSMYKKFIDCRVEEIARKNAKK